MQVSLKLIAASLTILFLTCNQEPKVPHSENLSLVIDGVLSENDWKKALVFDLEKRNKALLIQDNENVFIGLDNNENVLRYVDVYIASKINETLNFHASMQLGERKLVEVWNDTIPKWHWGNNKGWKANRLVLRGKDLENLSKSQLNIYNDYELKISKKKLKSKNLRMYIEIKDMYEKESKVCFPTDSIRYNTKNWQSVHL